MPKITHAVTVRQPNGLIVTLAAGEELPEWAIPLVTNPKVLAAEETRESRSEGETPEDATPEPPATTTPSPESATPKPSHAEVVARAKELGLKAKGSTVELLERIAAHEATLTPPVDPTPKSAGPGDGEDGEDPVTRASLEAKATELGLSFTEETTDAELEALVDAEG
ncbi:hypothetical protein SK224_08325 [Microbacterium sp. BG28]|uniref:hypothetical protein n=1 Tax=Microbacterium sp. BG28 TaxID=3097356 RepID=UPI002A5A345D|nr:hypothetical protein [Microbacterium sp. BG28]MDY0829130.1 hypothetical protein [Microbacterium sp. BG28]